MHPDRRDSELGWNGCLTNQLTIPKLGNLTDGLGTSTTTS